MSGSLGPLILHHHRAEGSRGPGIHAHSSVKGQYQPSREPTRSVKTHSEEPEMLTGPPGWGSGSSWSAFLGRESMAILFTEYRWKFQL